MMNQWQEEKFDAYFHGSLVVEERVEFEKQMESDPELLEAYLFYCSIKKASAANHRDEIRSSLEDVVISSPKVRRLSPYRIVASLAALLFAGILFFKLVDQPATNEEMFASYFEIYSPSEQRDHGENNDLFDLYKNGDFDSFLIASENYPSAGDDNEVLMMQALSYIQLDNLEAAKKLLLNINNESSLRDKKYWYLGLLSLKEGNQEALKAYFATLSKLSNFKKDEIGKILKHLS